MLIRRVPSHLKGCLLNTPLMVSPSVEVCVRHDSESCLISIQASTLVFVLSVDNSKFVCEQLYLVRFISALHPEASSVVEGLRLGLESIGLCVKLACYWSGCMAESHSLGGWANFTVFVPFACVSHGNEWPDAVRRCERLGHSQLCCKWVRNVSDHRLFFPRWHGFLLWHLSPTAPFTKLAVLRWVSLFF